MKQIQYVFIDIWRNTNLLDILKYKQTKSNKKKILSI